jgi:hypothetical protein
MVVIICPERTPELGCKRGKKNKNSMKLGYLINSEWGGDGVAQGWPTFMTSPELLWRRFGF